jgi:pimeloyl-ACP methyl ester carboxylesterase
MATYVLIPGAGSDSWYWHLVVPRLTALGHQVITPDLPCDDDAAGLAEYTDTVVDAIGDRTEVILVAQSMGGFTAPMVAERVPTALIVMLAAMTPKPGESPGEWWDATGHAQAKRAMDERDGRPVDAGFDPLVTFLHDVPAEVATDLMSRPPLEQSGTPFGAPWPLKAWPQVPTRFLLCRDDRFFPADFQRRVVRERLGFTPDEMDGGHLPALSRPAELVERLEAYRTGLPG